MRSIADIKLLESIRASLQAPQVVAVTSDLMNPYASLNHLNRE